MSNSVNKIADLENSTVEVKISEVSGKDKKEFIAQAKVATFDPNNMVANGGPVTKKAVSLNAFGSTYDDAYNNVLDKIVSLMGL